MKYNFDEIVDRSKFYSVIKKMIDIKKEGVVHGEYEGNELQLPACFVIDQAFIVRYARYGRHAGDTPEPEELSALLAQL